MNRPPLVTMRSPGFRPSSTSIESVIAAPGAYGAVGEQSVAGNHPDVRCIAFVDDRRLRYRGRLRRIAGRDAKIREHFRLQRQIAVVDFGPHRQPMGHRIDERRHIGDARIEGALRIGRYVHFHGLPQVHRTGVGLAHVRQQPHARGIRNGEHRRAAARLQILARARPGGRRRRPRSARRASRPG